MNDRGPSLARELSRSPVRTLWWLVATPPGVLLFFVWTVLVGGAMVAASAGWRAWLAAARRDPAPRRWRNPGLAFVPVWIAGFSVLACAIWGIRLTPGPEPPPNRDDEVSLFLLTHGPAVPAILVIARVLQSVGRLRFFAPTKKELTPLLRWPGVSLGVLLPIDRRAGESATAALERELLDVPLAGATVAIFPEGHRVRRHRLVASAARAREWGYEPLRRHLEPHPKGAYTLVRALDARARAEDLRMRVYFATYDLDRHGWGERLGPLHTLGARVGWAARDVTDEALAAATDLATFADWLRSAFVRADAAMSHSPLLDDDTPPPKSS